MNVTAEINRPTPSEVRLAIIEITKGRYQRATWPGYLRIYRDEDGEVVIENLEERK